LRELEMENFIPKLNWFEDIHDVANFSADICNSNSKEEWTIDLYTNLVELLNDLITCKNSGNINDFSEDDIQLLDAHKEKYHNCWTPSYPY